VKLVTTNTGKQLDHLSNQMVLFCKLLGLPNVL